MRNEIAGIVVMFAATSCSAAAMPDHYCGLYAAHAAMRAAGVSVPFIQLCDTRYVGSYEGSSLEELERAIRDNGGFVRPLRGLTIAALRHSDHPLILHVRRLGRNSDYNHWIAYLGADEQGRVRVVDPPHGVAIMEFAELNALWDGIGLVVSDRPIPARLFWVVSFCEGGVALGIVLGAILVLRRRLGPKSVGLALIGSTTALAGAMIADRDSFLRQPNAVGLVYGHHQDPRLAAVDSERMTAIVRSKSHLIIDCRFPAVYDAGHVPTAENLPISSGPAQQLAFLKEHPRDIPVVVYCQSEQCGWSDSLAAAIYHFGYRNTAVYRGGWNDWVSHGQD